MSITHRPSRKFFAAGLLLALLIAGGPGVAAAMAGDDDIMVVGLLVRGREVDIAEVVRRDGAFLLPLLPLLRAIGASFEPSPPPGRLLTPLGAVTPQAGDLLDINGLLYLHQSFIAEHLHIAITFVQEEFALALDVPWNPGAKMPVGARPTSAAQFQPPRFGLATIKNHVAYTELNGDAAATISTFVSGRVFEGAWRIDLTSDFEDITDVRNYVWSRSWNSTLLQIGHQQIALHPLLTGSELTGVQIGWTNQPLERFALDAAPRELLPRYAAAVQTFRGQAAPGFLAQLRVDGRIVDYRVIGLDRRYEFTDVPIASGALTRVEVYLFDYRDARAPSEIHEFTITGSALLLPNGTRAWLAGIGASGNASDKFVRPESAEPSELQSFLQWRQGLFENLTVEAAVQQHSEAVQAQLGLIARPFETLILEAGGGLSHGAFAYQANLELMFPRWRLLASSRFLPESYSLRGDSAKDRTHHAELHYRLDDRIQIGLKSRYHATDTDRTAFVLPFASWSPGVRLLVRAMPDADGEYRLDGYAWLTSAMRLSFLKDEGARVELSYKFHSRYGVALSARFADGKPDEYAVMVRRQAGPGRDPYGHAGVTVRDDTFTYAVGGGLDIFPGLQAEVSYQGHASDMAESDAAAHTLRFKLSAEFSVSGGRLFPVAAESLRHNQGAIAGRIVVHGSPGAARAYEIQNLTILVGPDRKVRTDRAGNFFCANLPEGVYVVELDPEHLPFELVSQRTVVTARVAAGAVTGVEFVVRPEYGIAGRVTDRDGAFRAQVTVELLDASGTVIKTAVTDQFGLYRIDGLPSGVYTLRLAARHLPDSPARPAQRPIVIERDVLFGQDLSMP